VPYAKDAAASAARQVVSTYRVRVRVRARARDRVRVRGGG
tara:strand:+ start:333 stop:452 length:120 start_codon:yes stop_codon:yes gene_type:complete